MREDCHHWHWAGQRALALEKQMNTVLDVSWQRHSKGWRAKNCFLHSPSSPRNVLSAELKLRRDFCSQDLTHWKFPLQLSRAQARNRSSLRRRSWHSLGRVPAAVPDQGLQQLFTSSLPLAPEITLLCGSLAALRHTNSCCASAHKHHFSMKGQQRPAESRDPLPWQHSTLQG